MKTKITRWLLVLELSSAGLVQWANAQSQTPYTIDWQRTYGGSKTEQNDYSGHTVAASSDGGYAFIGESRSNDGDVSGNHGQGDAWVVKIDGNGIIQWQRCIGGNQNELARFIIATQDGGFLAGGRTQSNNSGDIANNHGSGDGFVAKLNAAGSIEWTRTLGSNKLDYFQDALQDADGSYMLAGLTNGNNGDVSGNHGGQDAWVVKLSSTGSILWQRCYGGSGDDGNDHTTKIIRSTEGGYMLSTNGASSDGDVNGFHGIVGQDIGDCWVVKLDDSGNIQWNKCFGGPQWDYFENIVQGGDGDYIASGGTRGAASGDTPGSYDESSNPDWWVVRFSQAGTMVMSRHYGGSGAETLHGKIFLLPNGDMILPSGSRSNDHDCVGTSGLPDVWIVKTDAQGNILSYNIMGGPGYENMCFAVRNNDGSLVVAAMTDPTEINDAGHDANAQLWILKLIPNPADTLAITTTSLSLSTACPGASPIEISVAFTTRGTFKGNNVFTAELSDGNGSFASPIPVGSLHGSSSGIMACTIPAGLSPGKYYAIRLKSNKPAFTGITSGHFVDMVPCNNRIGMPEDQNDFSMELWPNPVKDKLELLISLNHSQRMTVQIVDMQGRSMIVVADKIFSEGENEMELNTHDLASGVYMLKIQSVEAVYSKKLIVTK